MIIKEEEDPKDNPQKEKPEKIIEDKPDENIKPPDFDPQKHTDDSDDYIKT